MGTPISERDVLVSRQGSDQGDALIGADRKGAVMVFEQHN